MKSSVLRHVSLLAGSLLLAGAAQASLIVYTTQASYLAAISSPGVDTYNDLDFTTNLATPQSRTAGIYAYTASVGPLSDFFPAGNTAADVWLATNNRTDTVTFGGFSSGVVGVGGFFFRSDISGLSTNTAATLSIMATDADGSATQTLVNPTINTFLGFVSTSGMSSLKVWVGTQGIGTAGVWPTINDLTLGAARTTVGVPEPETLSLLGIAMVGLVAAGRRKK